MEPILKPEVKYTKLFINNKFVDSVSGKEFDTVNPTTFEVIAKVQEGDYRDIAKAVEAAESAFDRNSEWRRMDASARGALLYRLSELLLRDLNYLASLESYNNGKPFALAHKDVKAASSLMKFMAGAADKVSGRVVPADGNKFVYTLYEPIGVCAAITPWNYPILIGCIKIAHCLTMGNTMVLKPAEQTPLTSLALAALIKEAGFPAGVFNVVPGFGPTAGLPLVQHPTVRKVTFTGSTSIGKMIQREAAQHVKRVTLELGGKSPIIVFPNSDIEKAVEVAHRMVFINQGASCMAASRTYVHGDIYDEFVKRSIEWAQGRKLGNPLDLNMDQGPQIDEEQFNKIMDLIESGKRQGAKLECGGKRVGNIGYFVEPTIFSNVGDDMRIAKEEIFGPVQSIFKFHNVDEVIKRVNSGTHGLGAGVFNKNIDEAFYVSSRIDAGEVYVNNYLNHTVQIPFGGFKESGLGREFGLEGLTAYYELKSVIIDLPFKM